MQVKGSKERDLLGQNTACFCVWVVLVSIKVHAASKVKRAACLPHHLVLP